MVGGGRFGLQPLYQEEAVVTNALARDLDGEKTPEAVPVSRVSWADFDDVREAASLLHDASDKVQAPVAQPLCQKEGLATDAPSRDLDKEKTPEAVPASRVSWADLDDASEAASLLQDANNKEEALVAQPSLTSALTNESRSPPRRSCGSFVRAQNY